MARSPISVSCKLTRQGNPGFASTIRRRAPFCASSSSLSEKSGSNCASGKPTIRKFVFMATRSTTLPPPNTRFLLLFFRDPPHANVLLIKLETGGLGHARCLNGHDHVFAGARNGSGAGVFVAVLKCELDLAFSGHLTGTVRFRRSAVSV